MSLDPDAYSASMNDTGSNWCAGTNLYYSSSGRDEHGSPGSANPNCP